MFTSITVLAILSIQLCSFKVARCHELEQTLEKLNSMLPDVELQRRQRDVEHISQIWQKYEFDTGAGNREELVVTNISVHNDLGFPSVEIKWEFLDVNGVSYLLGTTESILTLCELNIDQISTKCVNIEIDGRIFTSKLISINGQGADSIDDVAIILCMESNGGTLLRWYRVHPEYSKVEQFWTWEMHRQIKSIEYIRQENLYKLLLLYDDDVTYEQQFSLIHVYEFTVDFAIKLYDLHYCQTIAVHRPLGIRVCSVHENPILAIQGIDNIQIYEYRGDMTTPCNQFDHSQDVKSNNLKNFDCFDSGYIQYLTVSGPEAGLFHYLENEFQYNKESEKYFNDIADISWVKSVQVDTYREESLLLLQLKNFTVIALAWQGLGFVRVPLPNRVLDKFDLSRTTAISRFGFISGNQLVRIETKLKDLWTPIRNKVEGMIRTKTLLEEVLKKQEYVLDQTEERYNKSYLKNPVVTGFWNISKLIVNNANMGNVSYHSVLLDTKHLTAEDLQSNITSSIEILNDFEERLNVIEEKLNDAIPINLTEVDFQSDIDIFGNFEVRGTLHVKNLTIASMNSVPLNELLTDYVQHDDHVVINGKKSFPSFESDIFAVGMINGIPIEEILFSDYKTDHHGLNLSKVNRLVIDGNLSLYNLNDVNWKYLLENVVWKNKPASIPGETIIEGELIAHDIKLDNLNGLSYPDEYVPQKSKFPINITAPKNFSTLTVTHLIDIRRINDIDIDDFIILNKDNVLEHEITFQDLIVDGNCQADGNITGIDLTHAIRRPMLNESRDITADTIFANLTVLGHVSLRNSLNGKTWSDFDDLLLRTDKEAVITGSKTFLREAVLGPQTVIKSGSINGRPIENFVSTDTVQVLPNLRRISANVTFGHIRHGAVEKLGEYIASAKCLDKRVVFKVPPIVDELTFSNLNGNVTYSHFMERLKRTLDQVHFENLSVEDLTAENIASESINGYDLTDLAENRVTQGSLQNLTGECVIDDLQADSIDAEYINGMSLDEFNNLRDRLLSLYHRVFDENRTISSLNVTGMISMKTLNGLKIQDVWQNESAKTLVFEKDIRIKNLTVLGFVNGLNFSELVEDAVLKDDADVIITGHKTFETVVCNVLDTQRLNGHSVDNIFDPNKEQVLTGPVIVNGTVKVLQSFDSSGKIDGVPFHDLMKRFKYLGNNSFELRGDFRFGKNVSVKHLYVDGEVQGVNINDFLQNIIYKNDTNILVTGLKTFENSVTFNKAPIIKKTLNELDLKKFYEKAVIINSPFSINADVVFKEDVVVEGDLIVEENFRTNTIMDVDFNDLEVNALHKNQLTSVLATMTFADVTFQSNVNIEYLNDIDMNMLIPLHTEQRILSNRLQCVNATVKNLEIKGHVNEYHLDSIYKNTLMTTGDQNVTGHISFRRGVHTRRDFLANEINGMHPKQIVMLDTNDTIIGNFEFAQPVYFNGSLRILGQLNKIDPLGWKTVAIGKDYPQKQIVSGKWKVHGNVYFEKGVEGDGLLNDVNVTELASTVREEALRMEKFTNDTERSLIGMCSDVSALRRYAENQIYKFNTFDYMQIFEFDLRISSVHYVESEHVDHMLVSYETCHLYMFVHNGTKFTLNDTLTNFGSIDRWITLQSENVSYVVTVGKRTCGRNSGNLWRLENYEISHVRDLGNVTDATKINNNTFLILLNRRIHRISIGKEIITSEPLDYENYKFVVNSDRILLTNNGSIYEYVHDKLHKHSCCNHFCRSEVIGLKAGIFRREMLLNYDESANDNEIFIYDGNVPYKFLQSIKAHKPKSVVVLNFEGDVETLIVFVENNMYLQIYEYQGVLGFIYRDTIKLNADRLFYFKLRKYRNLVKRHYLAVIHGNRLSILEAKMHGEKLDIDELSCPAY